MKTRVSVTDLNQVAYYYSSEYQELDELLARLRRETPLTPDMLAGTAWHDLLEHHQGGELAGTIEHDGFTFTIDCEAEVQLGQAAEVPGEVTLDVDGVEVTVRARADALAGNKVIDYKLTKNADPERYVGSVQWRAYMLIFGCQEFEYLLFKKSQRGMKVKITDVIPCTFHWYDGLVRDLKLAIHNYLTIARQHLPERFTDE